MDQAPIHSTAPLPAELLAAYWRYDRALLDNDVEALEDLFVRSPETLRADPSGVLVGSTAINDFRRARPDRPRRRIGEVWAQHVAPDLWYTTAEVRSATGATGLQTQLWRRDGDRWRIQAAHVTPPSTPIDSTVWRVVGAPLVAGAAAGPLRGETLAVKDLYAIAGLPRGGGVKAYLDGQRAQEQTAPAVQALLAAGADVAGIAHTDQFAFGLAGRNADWGIPVNAAAPTRIPGGSSSGSACAVRRGWASIGVGTDTAGSIRVPADYQGLWGIRPTHDAIDTAGILPLAPSFDTVGWLTRAHDLLQTVGAVLLPADTAPPPREAVWSPALNAVADERVEAHARSIAEAVAATPLTDLPDTTAWTRAFRTVQAAEAWDVHGPWIERHPGALAPDVEARFVSGRTVAAEQLEAAGATIRAARTTMQEILTGRYLVLPATGSAIPRVSASPDEVERHRASTLGLTTVASACGLPSVVVPVTRIDDAPAGIALIGAAGTDRALIAAAGEVAARLAQE